MSKFSDAMQFGGAALMDRCGDIIDYWPAGVEADEITIDGIFTGQVSREPDSGRMRDGGHRAELQVWADDTNGVADPAIKSDIAVVDGENWRVIEIVETVGGMHRLMVERIDRNVVGRGRGRGI